MESNNKRSSAMEEIFAAKPDFLLRRANVVFLSVLLLLILSSTQITFPQIVNVHLTFQSGEFGMAGTAPGYVDSGQAAVLTVASYPPGEYGYLKGSVLKKSDGSLTIKLNDGVTTTSHKQIPLKDGMQADAEIVIGEVSLLQRLIVH